MIILCLTPVAVGVVAVVDTALVVLVSQTLLGALLGLAVFFHNALGAVLHIGMDKHVQAVFAILQNVVGAAADDDARTLIRQSADHIGLADKQLVSHGHGVHHGQGIGGNGDIEQETVGHRCIFACFFDEVCVEAAFFRHLIDQFLVIIRNVQALCNFFADGAAAAAECAADGDHFLRHGIRPP